MTAHEYEIILSPDLQLTTAAWNDLTETRTVGPARIEKAKGAQYDPTLVTTILITVIGGAAANLLSESIMKIVEKHGKSGKHIHIERIKKPDGTESFIADIDEE